jgi:hypothetical protein
VTQRSAACRSRPRRGAPPRTTWENIRGSVKIKRTGNENPRRKGSQFYKLYEMMGKCRTVGAYVEKGGALRWLPGAVKREYIKLVG